jgi:hypothetical protein
MRKMRLFLLCAVVFMLSVLPASAQPASQDSITLTHLTDIPVMPALDTIALSMIMAWSPDGSRLATYSMNHDMLQLWDASTGDELAAFPSQYVQALAFSADGALLAAVGQPILVFDVNAFVEAGVLTPDDQRDIDLIAPIIHSAFLPDPDANGTKIYRAAFTPDAAALMVVNAIPSITSAFDTRNRMDIAALAQSSQLPPSTSFDVSLPPDSSPTGYTLTTTPGALYEVTRDTDANYTLHTITADADSGTVVYTSASPSFSLPSPFFVYTGSADGHSLVAVDGRSKIIHLARLSDDGTEWSELEITDVDPSGIAISADGSLLALSGAASVDLYDAASGEQIGSFEPDGRIQYHTLSFSPDNSKFVVVTSTGSIEVWSLPEEFVIDTAAGITAAPTTQTGACDIDLSDAMTMLTIAQDAASAGNTEGALDQIGQARDSLVEIEAACSGGGDTTTTTSASTLGETYTVEGESIPVSLTFDYPSEWVVGDVQNGAVVVANQADLADIDLSSSAPPTMASGEAALIIAPVDTNYFGQRDLGRNATAEDLINALLDTLPSSYGVASDVETLSIADHPAAQATISGDNFDLRLTFVELGHDGTEPIFGMAFLLTAPGEADEYQSMLLAVAETFDLKPLR